MSVTVATKDELDALKAELDDTKRRLAALEGAEGAAELLTPREVARKFKVADALVYGALDDGHLSAEKKPAKNKAGFTYRITPDEARDWYARFVRVVAKS